MYDHRPLTIGCTLPTRNFSSLTKMPVQQSVLLHFQPSSSIVIEQHRILRVLLYVPCVRNNLSCNRLCVQSVRQGR